MIQHNFKNSHFHIDAIESQSITLMGPSEIPQTVTMTHAGYPLPLPREWRPKWSRMRSK